jgi:hypothetical protein
MRILTKIKQELEVNDSKVLLLDSASETVLTSLKTNNLYYDHNLLNSSVKNWKKICHNMETNNYLFVIGKLNPYTISLFSNDEYSDIADKLLILISKIKNAIYVYEGLFDKTCDLSYYKSDLYDNHIHQEEQIGLLKSVPTWEQIDRFFLTANKYNINLIPYRKNVSMKYSSQLFIEDAILGNSIKIYIPKGRIWESELKRMLDVFVDYLERVKLINTHIESTNTSMGTVYYIRAKDISQEEFNKELSQFNNLLHDTLIDGNILQSVLLKENKNRKETIELLNRYKREASRIFIDIEHEKERKLLNLKQTYELLLSEFNIDNKTYLYDMNQLRNVINSLENEILCNTEQSKQLVIERKLPDQLMQQMKLIRNGNIDLTDSDHEIELIIEKYADTQVLDLKSALYILNDRNTKIEDRTTSKEKLLKFLYKIGNTVKDIGISVLTSYLDKKINGE